MPDREVFKYCNPKAWKSFDCRLEVGLDSVRFGYFPHPISWHQSKRFASRGWQFIPAKKFPSSSQPTPAIWRKKHPESGMMIRHTGPFEGFPGWVSVQGSLAKLVQPDNSCMDYDSNHAFEVLKCWVDDEVILTMPNFTRVSPAWIKWFVNRVDITGDFVFDRAENIAEIIENLRHVTIPNRPRFFEKKFGMKWMSKSNRIALSVYDKFEKDPLPANKGKLRVTVIIQDKKSKAHLDKYNMKSVKGVMVRSKWLKILCDEILKMRPAKKAGVLRLIVNEAWKAQAKGAKV